MGNAESAAQAYMDSLVDSTNAMADSVGKMTGFATQKVYHLKLDGRRLIVVLRHDLSGARRLFVNNKLVNTLFVDGVVVVRFKHDVAGRMAVQWDDDYSGFLYAFMLGDKRVPELNELTTLECEPIRASVTKFSKRTEEAKVVVYYTVESSTGSETEPVVVERRFTEFVDLDDKARATFYGNHLLNSVPALPPKGSAWLVDQTTPEFCEERYCSRGLLEAYIRRLVSLPRMPIHPDLLTFLGRDPRAPLRNIQGPFLGSCDPGYTALIERAVGSAAAAGRASFLDSRQPLPRAVASGENPDAPPALGAAHEEVDERATETEL